MARFRHLHEIFRTYGRKYEIDSLLLAAQGYQESKLNQALRSAAGAVGIMQVIPCYAAGPINISNVGTEATANIHAGAKMLRHKVDRYFHDAAVDALDAVLFALASYNAGPNRIVGLRKRAASQGLNPNVWFENVELVAAQAIGQETVNYVRDVYKYYVAYKLSEKHTGSVEPAASQGDTATVRGILSADSTFLSQAVDDEHRSLERIGHSSSIS